LILYKLDMNEWKAFSSFKRYFITKIP